MLRVNNTIKLENPIFSRISPEIAHKSPQFLMNKMPQQWISVPFFIDLDNFIVLVQHQMTSHRQWKWVIGQHLHREQGLIIDDDFSRGVKFASNVADVVVQDDFLGQSEQELHFSAAGPKLNRIFPLQFVLLRASDSYYI